tara:strand:- start:51709 stop:52467 length:759 start_codon:yes stop_codon:yes gene_type:complete
VKGQLTCQKGSALVEHIIAWPLLLLLTLGTLQMGMLYKAKLTLNHATFQAAREGSVNHGRGRCKGCSDSGEERMRAKLIEAMAPLYMKGAPGIVSYGKALLSANNSQLKLKPVEIISPDYSIFKAFKQNMYTLNCNSGSSSKCKEQQELQIPNDNLNVRSDKLKKAGTLILNIQDANLLKIRTSWCYSLDIPVANKILFEIVQLKFTDPNVILKKINCAARAVAKSKLAGRTIYMIPISATSTVQMQTPFIW